MVETVRSPSAMHRLAKSVYRALPFKPALMAGLRRVAKPPERIYRHLHFNGPFRVELPGGRAFIMHHFGKQVENDLFWAGYGNGWEATSLRLWAVLAERASAVYDIGANTGTYGLAAKTANPAAQVVAFEPVARVYDRLAANARLNNGAMETQRLALSDHVGTATLFDSGGDHIYSASLNHEMLGEAGDRSSSEVAVTTLDAFVETQRGNAPELIKIDAEMHEPEVLAGGQTTIAANRPAILVEILNADIGERVAGLLPGYLLYEIAEGRGLARSDNPGAMGDRNYLALPSDDPRVATIGDSLAADRLAELA